MPSSHTRHGRYRRLAHAGAAAVLGLVAAGSLHAESPWCVDNCANIPRGTMPAATGTYVRLWQHVQVTGANEDDFVIYRHEWYLGGQLPGPYGLYHLKEMAKRLPRVPFPVVIQPDRYPALDEARRAAVVQLLTHYGVGDAQRRVMVAFPKAEGLDGMEAARDYLRSVSGRGAATGGAAGATGALGGGLGGTGGGYGGGAFGGVGGSLGIMSRGY